MSLVWESAEALVASAESAELRVDVLHSDAVTSPIKHAYEQPLGREGEGGDQGYKPSCQDKLTSTYIQSKSPLSKCTVSW